MRATPTPFTRRFVPPPSSLPLLLSSSHRCLLPSAFRLTTYANGHNGIPPSLSLDIIIFLPSPSFHFFHPRSIDFTLYVCKLNRWRKRGRKRKRFQIGERRKKGMEGNWWNFLCPRWWYGMPIPQCGPKRAAERRDRYQGKHFAM